MQELHFVGFTSNHEGLLLSSHEDATSGDYFVQIDEYLAAAIEQRPGASSDGQNREGQDREEQQPREEPRAVAPPRPPTPRPVARTRPKPASHLSPREIQARLRGGSSVAEVAEEAGVDEEWVLRFADPILAEQSRVVQRALQLTFTKPRVGPSSQPLRESVRWNLADQGALRDDEVFDAGWSAFNPQGSKWVVRFSFSAKRRRKVAEWEVDLRKGELKARNRVATDLGYVEPGRRRRPPPEELPPAPSPRPRARRQRGRDKAAQKAPATKKAPANKAAKARKRGPASKAATRLPKRSAPKAAAKKSATKAGARTAGRTAAATKSAVRKQAAKKSAPRRAVEPRKASKKATAKRKAAGAKPTA